MTPPKKEQRSRGRFTPVGVLLTAILTGSVLLSQAGEIPAIDMPPGEFAPLELSFFQDLSDGTLNEYDDYDAFLIASGIIDLQKFSAGRKQLEKIRRQILAGLDREADPYALGKDLLFGLHDRVFKKYVETASSAGHLLDRGEYNCLSSSILYHLMARDLGLAVGGVLVPNHTFCILSDDRGDKIIETTARYGFDPGKVEIEKLKNVTRYVYVPEATYTEKKAVTVRQMLSLLYTNSLNLSGFVVHDDYAEYLPKFKKAALLDPENELFRENLLVCLNNLAVLALESHDLEGARSLIQQGKRVAPAPGLFEEVEIQYFNQAARGRADSRDYSGAVQFIQEGLRLYAKNSVLTNNMVYFYGVWAESFIQQDDHASAVNIFLGALASFPENEEIRENLRIAFYNHAARTYNSHEFENAAAICRKALDFFPGDDSFSGILTAAETMLGR